MSRPCTQENFSWCFRTWDLLLFESPCTDQRFTKQPGVQSICHAQWQWWPVVVRAYKCDHEAVTTAISALFFTLPPKSVPRAFAPVARPWWCHWHRFLLTLTSHNSWPTLSDCQPLSSAKRAFWTGVSLSTSGRRVSYFFLSSISPQAQILKPTPPLLSVQSVKLWADNRSVPMLGVDNLFLGSFWNFSNPF